MRGTLNPEEFRAAGIYLNGGRRRGWRKHLALLLGTPESTIVAWASRSPTNARSVPGSTAVALKLLVAMLRQKELTERDPFEAAQIVTEQVLTLAQVGELLPSHYAPIAPTARRIRKRAALRPGA